MVSSLAVALQVPTGDGVAGGLAALAVLARVGPVHLAVDEGHIILGKA